MFSYVFRGYRKRLVAWNGLNWKENPLFLYTSWSNTCQILYNIHLERYIKRRDYVDSPWNILINSLIFAQYSKSDLETISKESFWIANFRVIQSCYISFRSKLRLELKLLISCSFLDPLSANPTKWSNALKQFDFWLRISVSS